MHILIVQNRKGLEPVVRRLKGPFPDAQLTEISGEDAFRQALERGSFDLVLTGQTLRWADGRQVLRAVKARFPHVPVVMLIEPGGEEAAVEGMREGLSDYLLENQLDRLPAVIQGSVERAEPGRQAEEALRASQARLEAVFAAVPNVLIECDVHLRLVGASEATLKAMGASSPDFTRDDAVAKLQFRHLDGSPVPKGKLPIARALQGERVSGEIYRVCTADQGERIVAVYAAPFYRDGQVDGIVALWHDITERQQAEEALERSNRRLSETMESILDGFFALDRDWCFTYINERAAQNVGHHREELIGRNLWQQFPGILGTAHERHYRQAMDEGTPTRFEMSGVLTESSYEIRAYPSTEGISVYWLDITERKRAEQERERLLAEVEQAHRLSETLNRVNTLLGSSLDAEAALPRVLVEAAQGLQVEAGVISRWDGEHWKMQHGYGVPATLLGREYTDAEAEGWVRAARGRQVLVLADTQEDPLMRSEAVQAYRMRSLLVVPLLQKERVVGVMSFASRSTPTAFGPAQVDFGWKLATAISLTLENAQLYEQARRDAETRATLLREVNHRVKNNLVAIIGLLYAQMDSPTLANHPEYEAAIRELTRRIEGLSVVHGMLSAVEWTPLPLDELAERIVAAALQAMPADRVNVEVRPSGVHVSPDQAHALALVLNELALNAGKHALRAGIPARVTISATREEENVLLLFRDNGPGYPDDVVAGRRTGIGLALLQNLVHRNLHGQLLLRNDAGAVAEVRFPPTEAQSES